MNHLIEEMNATEAASPTLWWLGHCGFAVKYRGMVFYIDPCLSRTQKLDPAGVTNADLILCTHAHAGHMDPATLPAMLAASPRAKVVLPKSAAEHARSIGIPYERMTTTDSDLRIEYFKDGLYGRVYAVPSAHPELNWTPIGGYPQLGYLIRFGACTIYHAGDCRPYDGIVERLRPYSVTVALLPINGGGNFSVSEAAELAENIGARWAVPMHYDASGATRFIDHMLGFRPTVGFKVFQPAERWQIP
jgi:L-ascorbate metabolism protein UlaG (beta-lactamase superfamily)